MIGRARLRRAEQMDHPIKRKHPAEGVYIFPGQPTIAFLTVCSKDRQQKLADAKVHEALVTAWQLADAWSVGSYLIMPDHIHLFCSPMDEECTIEHWVTFWKRQFHRMFGPNAPRFQSRGFHHRLRQQEAYTEKWEYIRQNPVRAGLVTDSDDWIYQGKMNDLIW